MPVGTGRLLSLRSLIGALCVALAAYAVTAMLAAPAGAWEHNKAPEYSLSVVEGADTQPEDSIEQSAAASIQKPR